LDFVAEAFGTSSAAVAAAVFTVMVRHPQKNGRRFAMKWVMWAALAAIGITLFAGKDDIRRFRQMRQM
jgi:hypothetical protein